MLQDIYTKVYWAHNGKEQRRFSLGTSMQNKAGYNINFEVKYSSTTCYVACIMLFIQIVFCPLFWKEKGHMPRPNIKIRIPNVKHILYCKTVCVKNLREDEF